MLRKVFTTGQVAKICSVAPRTVAGWFDVGRLKGYRVAGSRDRRIPRDQLIRFMRENDMPLDFLLREDTFGVLLVGTEPSLLKQLRELLADIEDGLLDAAETLWGAGALSAIRRYQCFIFDLSLGRAACLHVARSLQQSDATLIALTGEDESDTAQLSQAGFSEAIQRPFDPALLAERIRTLAGEG